MRTALLLASALLSLQAHAQQADATTADAPVTVHFVDPDRFTDATYQNRDNTRERVTQDLAAYLSELGQRHLPAGQHLDIEITDIDLAGRYEPWRGQNIDVRYMVDVAWPSVNLRYRLSENGQVTMQGEQRVSDMNYLRHASISSSRDPLRYEKAMLDDWFRGRFDPKPKQASTQKP